MKLKITVVILCAGLLTILIPSCKKENATPPHNPYDDINRDSTINGIPVDSLTITYVHKKVLSTRCSLPACHDGTFEPDYRTPQSSYSTLVYATINKNNATNDYKYRVIPYDTTKSVLYQRITNCCFVNTNDRMPQDNIGVPLPDSSIALIGAWIMNGARDMFGNVPQQPDNEPVVGGYVAVSTNYQTVYSNTRLDSVSYNPFVVPDSVTQFYIGVAVSDDNTPISQMHVNQLKLSLNADDFSSAIVLPTVYFNASGTEFWLATVNTASLVPNDTIYMRYYVNDGHHSTNTEFPRTDLPFPYKSYFSFIRK